MFMVVSIPWNDIVSQFSLIPCNILPQQETTTEKDIITPQIGKTTRVRTQGVPTVFFVNHEWMMICRTIRTSFMIESIQRI